MDEEVAESWEEAADSGEMDRRLEKKLRISQRETDSNNHSRPPLKTSIVIQDDSLPMAPPPQIRILKRPTSNGSLGSPNQNRPTPQVKSLAQREAEYAEARKRILGSACPEETPQDNKTNNDRSGRVNTSPASEDTRSNNHTARQSAGTDGNHRFRQHR